MSTVYNRVEQIPANVLKALIQAGRNPVWAGHPCTDYAVATSLFLTSQKLDVLVVGSALRRVINLIAEGGFENTSQQKIPLNKNLDNPQFLIGDIKWINNTIVEYYLHLRDGFNDH